MAEEQPTRIVMRGTSQNQAQKFVKVNPKLEKKVRGLLEGTELNEIASTAKLVVEIVKDEQEQKPSALVVSKANLST